MVIMDLYHFPQVIVVVVFNYYYWSMDIQNYVVSVARSCSGHGAVQRILRCR